MDERKKIHPLIEKYVRPEFRVFVGLSLSFIVLNTLLVAWFSIKFGSIRTASYQLFTSSGSVFFLSAVASALAGGLAYRRSIASFHLRAGVFAASSGLAMAVTMVLLYRLIWIFDGYPPDSTRASFFLFAVFFPLTSLVVWLVAASEHRKASSR